jgi:transposase
MRKKYSSDISREQFKQLAPLLEGLRQKTRPRTVDLYEEFCAVLYLLKSGCQWRRLPEGFPKWRTVPAYFTIWSQPQADGRSVLERALKKSGWRGPTQTGAQRLQHVLARGHPGRATRGGGEHGGGDGSQGGVAGTRALRAEVEPGAELVMR